MRVLIGGGPRTGKTTLADKIGTDRGVEVLHTDTLIPTHAWSEASQEVSRWISTKLDERGALDTDTGWVIEGVAMSRAVRKLLAARPDAFPRGRMPILFIHLMRPQETLTPAQAVMAKGCATVFHEIEPLLTARGIIVAKGFLAPSLAYEDALRRAADGL